MAAKLSIPILVVDDYETMTRIIGNLLRKAGFTNIDYAHDGSAALAKLKRQKYKLILSDWNMQPMNGYEFLKAVRADPELSGIPFIMITAHQEPNSVVAAKQAGVSNYIVKPFSAQTLRSKIDAVFPEGKFLGEEPEPTGAGPAPAAGRRDVHWL